MPAELGYSFDNLTTPETLAVLHEVLPAIPEQERAKIRLAIGDASQVVVFLIDGEKLDKTEKHTLELLNQSNKRLGKPRPRTAPVHFGTRPWPEGATLLLATDWAERDAAVPNRKDSLLIAENDPLMIPLIYFKLCRHATHTHVAFGRAGDEETVFFQVYDRGDHGASFRAALQGDLLSGLTHLQAYPVGASLIFLPGTRRGDGEPRGPRKQVLDAFDSLTEALPEAFSLGPVGTWKGAIVPTKKGVQWVSLTSLQFRDQLTTLPEETLNAVVGRVHPLPAEDARRRLEASLKKEDWAYYKLSLLKNPHPRIEEPKYERLVAQRDKLTYEIELMESHRRARPRLYRFAHTDFRVLAGLLRGLPKRARFDEGLLYGFQAATGTQQGKEEGWHYLWVDDKILNLGSDTTRMFPVSPTTTVFELDYFWEKYCRGSVRSRVFVPRGTFLHPTIHPAETASVDDHLVHLVGSEPIPEQPVYLFEPSGNRLKISVLDRASFTTPKVAMGWLNDCLVATSKDVRAMVAKTARDFDHIQAARVLGEEAEQVANRFENVSRTVARALKEMSDETIALLVVEMEERLGRAGEQAQTIAELRPRLEALAGNAESLTALAEKAERIEKKTLEGVVLHAERTTQIQRKVKKELEKTQQDRKGLLTAIREEVLVLKERRRQARDFFFKNLWPSIFGRRS